MHAQTDAQAQTDTPVTVNVTADVTADLTVDDAGASSLCVGSGAGGEGGLSDREVVMEVEAFREKVNVCVCVCVCVYAHTHSVVHARARASKEAPTYMHTRTSVQD